MGAINILKLLLVLALTAHAHESTWRETNKTFFADVLDADEIPHWELTNPLTFSFIYTFVKQSGSTYYHLSGPRSFHHGEGGAVDFYVDSYKGMNFCERLERLAIRGEQFVWTLGNARVLSSVAVGLYPFNEKTPSIHFDTRGYPVFWMRKKDGSYRYFSSAKALLKEVKRFSDEC